MPLRKHRLTLDDRDLALVVDGIERHIGYLEDLADVDRDNRAAWLADLDEARALHKRLAAL